MQTFIQTVSTKKSEFTNELDPTFMICNSFVYPPNHQAFKLNDFSDLQQKDHTMSTTLLTLTNPLECSFLAISNSFTATFSSYCIVFIFIFLHDQNGSQTNQGTGLKQSLLGTSK